MFRIGEFSKMGKTTVKTLRYYDEIGLLKPERIDSFTGYRFYTTNQLVTLHRISSLRQVGLSIDEIRLVLANRDCAQILERRRAELLKEMDENRCRLSRIEFILSGGEEKNIMNYSAIVKELGECIVYSKRMTVPSYDSYSELIPEIGRKVSEKYPDLKCTVPEYCFMVYLDNEHKEKNIHVEYCEAVTELKEDFEDIVFKKIPSVTAVSVLHKGAYLELSKAYAYMFKWIEENEYFAVGSPRERYIDGIWNKEDEADWLTELQVPIAKKSEITDKYGDTEQYRQSKQKSAKYSSEKQKEISAQADKIFAMFAQNRDKSPECDEVQLLVGLWQEHITKYYYDCTKEILCSLGQMYVADERFTQNIDRFGVGTADLMSRAIEIYCK